jgi:hypothetical protein
MVKVTYKGPCDEVHLSELRVFVKQGETVEVPAEVAKELEAAGFVRSKSKTKAAAADKE